jgi:hypothetical protein
LSGDLLLRTTPGRRYLRGAECRVPHARRSAPVDGRSAGKSSPQFALDLAINAFELGGKIPHQHLQAPLAVIDDAPQFGALMGRKTLVGKPDPGLDDLATPQLRACVDEFDSSVWHALIPGVPHLVRQCHSAVAVSGGVAAWLMGRLARLHSPVYGGTHVPC